MPNQAPFLAYDAIVGQGASSPHTAIVADMRVAFMARTGHFGPESPCFEARSRAFWDDALTTAGFCRRLPKALDRDLAPWARAFERSHRGLFLVGVLGGTRVLRDVWSGSEFVLHHVSEGMREALDASTELMDARVVALAQPLGVALLPGAFFHPSAATDAVLAVVREGRNRGMTAPQVFDGLMRMELRFQSLERMKPSYAYRAEALQDSSLSQVPATRH